MGARLDKGQEGWRAPERRAKLSVILEVGVTGGITFNVQWRTVVTEENGQAYTFPRKFTRFLRDKYGLPAVYRWRVLRVPDGQPKEPIYIGEGDNLVSRIQRVLTPPKSGKATNTNRRLHDLFVKYAEEKRTIVVDVADMQEFELNGIRFGNETLTDRFKRRALENILLVLAQQEEAKWELLNVVFDPVEQAIMKAAKLMKTHPDIMRAALRKIRE
jgi:hypothetical protein